MKKLLITLLIAIMSIISILGLTNPSTNKFKDFIGNEHEQYLSYRRDQNWLIFSIYNLTYDEAYFKELKQNEQLSYRGERKLENLKKIKGTYLAVFLNFYKIQ